MKRISEINQEALLDVLDRHEQTLMAYDGVQYVDVGYKFKNEQPTDVLAIRVHVHEKKPEAKLDSKQILPHSIGGVPVDVIQSNPQPQQDRRIRYDPLVGGIQVKNTRRKSSGTLGVIVYDAKSLDPMGLSNYHVFFGLEGRVGDDIAQPSSNDSDDVIGTLARGNLSLDCAVCTLNDSRQTSQAILDYPNGVRSATQPVIGMAVTKSGMTTGTTFGLIDGVSRRLKSFTVVPDPDNPPPSGEISASGDSGSVWLEVGTTNAIGLHYAGEKIAKPERAWAMKMVDVLSALNIVLTADAGGNS